MSTPELSEGLLDDMFEEIMLRSVAEEVDMKDPQSKDVLIREVVEKMLKAEATEDAINAYKEAVLAALFRSETIAEVGREKYGQIKRGAQSSSAFSEHRTGK
ncbi:MAG: hypothetical protein KBC69_01120 [Candidatus Magasanikbacteria bacterium]|nr:hypothetical protein [Candidatus Magasanikbacteria bacterium]